MHPVKLSVGLLSSRLSWIVTIDGPGSYKRGNGGKQKEKAGKPNAEHSGLFSMQTGEQKTYALTDGVPKVTLPWRLCHSPLVFIVSLITC